jgi:ParB/RepB/Spo0J family partition protein
MQTKENSKSESQNGSRGATSPTLMQIEYGKLEASKTNPRKDFKKEAMEELAASIREHGIKQPLLVRPIAGGKFEVVAGERRYRGAGMAKLSQVPCMVEVMDDKTALEIQAIENLQREDLTAIEEAQGYKQLQDAGYSIEQLIEKTGKSRSRVFERLRLLKLSADIQKAVLEGKLDLSRASLIGQAADPKAQKELFTRAISWQWPHSTIKRELETKYQRNLQGAVFDVAATDLVKGCGACAACPRRSGNIATFEGSPNVCTDVTCFGAKAKAGLEIKIRELEAKGQKVVRGDWSGTYVELSASEYGLGWDNKKSRYKTWAEVLGKKKYTPLLAVKENGFVKVVARAEAKKLAGIKSESGRSNSGRSTAEDKKQKESREIRVEAEKRYIAALGPAILKGVGTEKGLREAMALLVELNDENCSAAWDDVAQKWGLPKKDKATIPQLIAGMVGMLGFDYEGELFYGWPKEKVFGLQVSTFEQQVKKEREEAAKAKTKSERPTSNVQRPTSNGKATKGTKKAGAK